MEVQLIPCYTDRNLFLSMARDYVNTLSEYDRTIRWDESIWTHAMWKAKFIIEGRTAQGFVITEPVLFAIFEDALYIEEFYVVPEARRSGVGLATVKAILSNWNKDVFLYILDKNRQARLFWNAVEAELEWKRINRPEIKQEKGCELRVYQTHA